MLALANSHTGGRTVMRIRNGVLAALGFIATIGSVVTTRADFAVEVDIENLSSERKTNWLPGSAVV
jgi:hypothetical protein